PMFDVSAFASDTFFDDPAETVQSWNGPPVTSGARNAIVSPSGENAGDALRRPCTRIAGTPSLPPAPNVATTTSADCSWSWRQIMAGCVPPADGAGEAQLSAAGVRAAPRTPGPDCIQTCEWTCDRSSIEYLV